MYTHPLNLYRGIDNVVKFQFRNNDQKKVPIQGKTITFNIIDTQSRVTHLTRTMSVEDGPNGIAKLLLSESDLNDIKEQFYVWSVKVVDGENNTHVAYTDDNYSASGQLTVKHGIFPEFMESMSLNFNAGNISNAVDAKPRLNNNSALHTAQFYFDIAYTGMITVQGTMDDVVNQVSNNWFDIKTINFTSQADPSYTSWNGIYSGVRFMKSDTGGAVGEILYRY